MKLWTLTIESVICYHTTKQTKATPFTGAICMKLLRLFVYLAHAI